MIIYSSGTLPLETCIQIVMRGTVADFVLKEIIFLPLLGSEMYYYQKKNITLVFFDLCFIISSHPFLCSFILFTLHLNIVIYRYIYPYLYGYILYINIKIYVLYCYILHIYICICISISIFICKYIGHSQGCSFGLWCVFSASCFYNVFPLSSISSLSRCSVPSDSPSLSKYNVI